MMRRSSSESICSKRNASSVLKWVFAMSVVRGQSSVVRNLARRRGGRSSAPPFFRPSSLIRGSSSRRGRLGVGVAPGDGALVAGVHAGPALDAVLELEVHEAALVDRVAVGRADVRRALVRADGVADRGVDEDVRLGVAAALVAVGDGAQPLGDAEGLYCWRGVGHKIEV